MPYKGEVSDMEYQADLHTHTVASGHAYNTIDEMVGAAVKNGLVLYGITEHSETMPGTCKEEYFRQLADKKKQYHGIEVLYGVELNIIDYKGSVDMDAQLLKRMDVAIASIHNGIGYESGSIAENTSAVTGAIENPYVNIIGHLDDDNIPVDYDTVINAAIENHTLLEINNNSFAVGCWRKNAVKNIMKIAGLCIKNNYPVVIGSDAHCVGNVARGKESLEFLKEAGFPDELILNYYPDRLKGFLNKFRQAGY